MNHPNREEMMSYLYDELEAEPRRATERHLDQCAPCRARLAEWRRTAQHLDAFAISPRTAQPAWQPRKHLAVAALAAVLVVGFLLGRMGGVSRAELEAVKRDSETQAVAVGRAEAQRQLQQFASDMGKRLDDLEAQQSRDYASLRKELETVAVFTEAGFRQTENRIVQLADTSSITAPNSTQ